MSPKSLESPEPVQLPTRLAALLPYSADCSCGRTHAVTTRWAVVRSGALDELPDRLAEVGSGLAITLVADRRTRQVAGERCAASLQAAGHRVQWCELADGAGGRPHADEAGLARVEPALAGADVAVAVGSGTVNDLVKLASYRRGIPYVVVATAPSMNGYTSAIAAIMQAGVKRTVDCHGPLGVIADLDVVRRAPAELVAAGLGDLESKPTASADFRLSGWLRGTYYCPAPERVVLEAEPRVADAAAGIGAGDPEALALLTEALLLSGLSMKLAGSSSPASGGEHLISHHWDMTAGEQGRVEGFHGAQVGVATIVTAALYEQLGELSPAAIDPEALVAGRPDEAACRARLARDHGERVDEVAAEFFSKRLDDRALRAELERIRDDWSGLWQRLAATLRPAARTRAILHAGGAPTDVRALGLTPDHLRRSLRIARDIRGRFTVLDLAAELGVLEAQADAVLQRSGCL